jgi:hypothetical protein
MLVAVLEPSRESQVHEQRFYGGWASAIIARTSAIALALRSLRDEWIIALSGYFNISCAATKRILPARHV